MQGPEPGGCAGDGERLGVCGGVGVVLRQNMDCEKYVIVSQVMRLSILSVFCGKVFNSLK
jgi:hypothetical protein